MLHVILQPAGDPDATSHYHDTIQNPVPLSAISKYFNSSFNNSLLNLYVDGRALIWGVTKGKQGINERKWGRIQTGDVVLFARKKKMFASAIVSLKVHNKELALNLWEKDEDGNPWEYIYFVDELRHIDISYRDFNLAVGYDEKYFVRGFSVLDRNTSAAFLDRYDLASDTYMPPVSKDDYFGVIAGKGSLDKDSKGSARVEQSFLRNHLFSGRKFSKCCICGASFPVSLLIAAHIKPRSKCTDKEKRDFENIVAPMCRFGCDELYEKGYISVVNGRVTHVVEKLESAAVTKYIEAIEYNECSYWNPATEKYFIWHYQNKCM